MPCHKNRIILFFEIVTSLLSSGNGSRILIFDLQILEIRYLLHYEIHIFPTQHKICKNESFNFKNGQLQNCFEVQLNELYSNNKRCT